MSTYLDKVLKKFKMDQSKKGFLHVLQGVKLSQTQCPTTTEDREKMKVIPYASAIGSIMYAMSRPPMASTNWTREGAAPPYFLLPLLLLPALLLLEKEGDSN